VNTLDPSSRGLLVARQTSDHKDREAGTKPKPPFRRRDFMGVLGKVSRPVEPKPKTDAEPERHGR